MHYYKHGPILGPGLTYLSIFLRQGGRPIITVAFQYKQGIGVALIHIIFIGYTSVPECLAFLHISQRYTGKA